MEANWMQDNLYFPSRSLKCQRQSQMHGPAVDLMSHYYFRLWLHLPTTQVSVDYPDNAFIISFTWLSVAMGCTS